VFARHSLAKPDEKQKIMLCLLKPHLLVLDQLFLAGLVSDPSE